MTQGLLQIALFCALLLAAMPLLGGYMARVFAGDAAFLAPVERRVHRLLRVDAAASMSWKAYARAVIVFSAVCWLALYLVLRTQGCTRSTRSACARPRGPELQHDLVVRHQHELAVLRGGVGTGLYSMLLFALLAVFIGGLMVGRTPEYLGKKVEARETSSSSSGRCSRRSWR